MTAIRDAAVAGRFYPGVASELSAMVQGYLGEVETAEGPVPKALIAPHAGYVYSGQIAASAYARLKPAKGRITRVILLGPCHRVPIQGLALSGADAFRTPLGDVPVDKPAAAAIIDMPQVSVFDPTHELEHSLEVHLPFLQELLDAFSVVPLVVGEVKPESVAEVLEALWDGPETLIVVSSDLSHYLDYDRAREIDRETCRAIENLDPDGIAREGACGRFPVGGLLTLAKLRGMTAETLDLRNSGDTAGPRDKVVGYGSWMFLEKAPSAKAAMTWHNVVIDDVPAEAAFVSLVPSNALEPGPSEEDFGAVTRALLKHHGNTLVRLAWASIDHGLEHGEPLPIDQHDHPPALRETGACFVTLKYDGQLRGCIGSSQAKCALVEDIADNAYRAAFKDPRFPALSTPERDALDLSISVLSPQTPISFSGKVDLVAQLCPGVDGLVIKDGNRRALFLPSVWSQLPEPAMFLERLKVKAGLKRDHWSDTMQAWRFVAEEISGDDQA